MIVIYKNIFELIQIQRLLLVFTLLLLTRPAFSQNVVEELNESRLYNFDSLSGQNSDYVVRMYVHLTDTPKVNLSGIRNLLELKIQNTTKNYLVYEQLGSFENLKVLSFRPSMENCDFPSDTDPCIFIKHRQFPEGYKFPKGLLILDLASPFIKRLPDRVFYPSSDLRMIVLDQMRHSDLPVAILKMKGLCYLSINGGGVLKAERIFFEKYKPNLEIVYGEPDWIERGEINYSNKYVKKVLQKKVKDQNPPKDGEFILYFKEGGVAIKGRFEGGYPKGNWELYNDQGVVIRKRSYGKDGSRTGTWQWFQDHGDISYAETYNEKGIRITSEVYVKHDDLFVYRREVFDSTNYVMVKTYFPSGIIESEHGFFGSDYHGARKLYYSNGQLKEVKYYDYGICSYSPASVFYDYHGNVLHKIENIPLNGNVADSIHTFLQSHQVELPSPPFTLRKSTKNDPVSQKVLVGYTYILPSDVQISIVTEYKNGSVNPLKTDILFNTEMLKSIHY